MYKDAPHEGFTLRVFLRSMVFGTLVALLISRVTGLFPVDAASLVLFFGLVYVVERAVAEAYKTFFRQQDQSKYTIPMQFGVMGKPMKDARKRITIGLIVAAACFGVFFAIRALEEAAGGAWPRWLVVVTVGSFFGWISAFGGAWKDAPIEGFETFKFFRSPAVAASWAFIVSLFIPSWTASAIAAEGFTVASIETYKTFVFPTKPRGKFAGKPILHPEHLERRRKFLPLYFGIWALVLGHLAWALANRWA
jgi:hypothetical protein